MKKPTTIKAKGHGKTWFRSLEAAQRRVVDHHEYLIRRGGAWFRPGAHGYTGDLAAVGVFVGSDAKGYLQAEGVELVPLTMMVPAIHKAARDRIKEAAALAKLIEHY